MDSVFAIWEDGNLAADIVAQQEATRAKDRQERIDRNATAAMQAVITGILSLDRRPEFALVAEDAYTYAEAMEAERERRIRGEEL